MLDIDQMHKFPLRPHLPPDVVRRARAAVAFRVVAEQWTAAELRDVLAALGLDAAQAPFAPTVPRHIRRKRERKP